MSIKLIILSLSIFFAISLFAQEDNSEIISIILNEKQRGDKLTYKKSIVFPKGEIVKSGFSAIDTCCFKNTYKPLNNEKLVKKLIQQIEKGKTIPFNGELTGSINFSLEYKDGRRYSFLCSKNLISIWLEDTTVIIQNLAPFLKEVKKINNDFIQDVSGIKNIDKIEVSYKKNKKIITSKTEITAILECLEEAEYSGPTSCPFYNGRIKFYSNGKLITASLAHDLCPVIIINKNYFDLNKQHHKKLVRILYRYVGFKPGP